MRGPSCHPFQCLRSAGAFLLNPNECQNFCCYNHDKALASNIPEQNLRSNTGMFCRSCKVKPLESAGAHDVQVSLLRITQTAIHLSQWQPQVILQQTSMHFSIMLLPMQSVIFDQAFAYVARNSKTFILRWPCRCANCSSRANSLPRVSSWSEVSSLSTQSAAVRWTSDQDFDWDFDVPSLESPAGDSPTTQHRRAVSFAGQHDSASTIYLEGSGPESKLTSTSVLPSDSEAKQVPRRLQPVIPVSAFSQRTMMDSASAIHVQQAAPPVEPLQAAMPGQIGPQHDVEDFNELTMRNMSQLSEEMPQQVNLELSHFMSSTGTVPSAAVVTHSHSLQALPQQVSPMHHRSSSATVMSLPDEITFQPSGLRSSGSWDGSLSSRSSSFSLPPRPPTSPSKPPAGQSQLLQQVPESQASTSTFILPFRPRTPTPGQRPAKATPLQRLSENHPSDGGPVIHNPEICRQVHARHALMQTTPPSISCEAYMPPRADSDQQELHRRASSLHGAEQGSAGHFERAHSAPLDPPQPAQFHLPMVQTAASPAMSTTGSDASSLASSTGQIARAPKPNLRRVSSQRHLVPVRRPLQGQSPSPQSNRFARLIAISSPGLTDRNVQHSTIAMRPVMVACCNPDHALLGMSTFWPSILTVSCKHRQHGLQGIQSAQHGACTCPRGPTHDHELDGICCAFVPRLERTVLLTILPSSGLQDSLASYVKHFSRQKWMPRLTGAKQVLMVLQNFLLLLYSYYHRYYVPYDVSSTCRS